MNRIGFWNTRGLNNPDKQKENAYVYAQFSGWDVWSLGDKG